MLFIIIFGPLSFPIEQLAGWLLQVYACCRYAVCVWWDDYVLPLIIRDRVVQHSIDRHYQYCLEHIKL